MKFKTKVIVFNELLAAQPMIQDIDDTDVDDSQTDVDDEEELHDE
tara:strand:+ start:622 stop:756 length:135 start_codon:yes stop_codon:yes gene_type:complete